MYNIYLNKPSNKNLENAIMDICKSNNFYPMDNNGYLVLKVDLNNSKKHYFINQRAQ